MPFVLLATETVSDASPHTLRRPTDAAPLRARNPTVENSGPRAAAGRAGQRAARHVAVVVEIAAEIDGGEIHRADARHTVRPEWPERSD